MEYENIRAKVAHYNRILKNTKNYRKEWSNTLKDMIKETLNHIIESTKLNAYVDNKDEIENLEIITLSLGTDISGIAEKLPGAKSKRPFIKNLGTLVFQQLFNGKIMIMIMYPHIEGYGEPKHPLTLEIVRPEELQRTNIIHYTETFLKEIIEWEDYDDDLPEQMGVNPIGFGVK